MKEFIEKWLWLILGVLNVIIALLIGKGVSSWAGDASSIAGYTFMMMFLVGGIEMLFAWNKGEYTPAAIITGGLAGTVLVLLLF